MAQAEAAAQAVKTRARARGSEAQSGTDFWQGKAD